MNPADISPAVALAFIVFAVLVAILWLLLPFAVFGLKPLVRELIEQTKRANQLQERTNTLLSMSKADQDERDRRAAVRISNSPPPQYLD